MSEENTQSHGSNITYGLKSAALGISGATAAVGGTIVGGSTFAMAHLVKSHTGRALGAAGVLGGLTAGGYAMRGAYRRGLKRKD